MWELAKKLAVEIPYWLPGEFNVGEDELPKPEEKSAT